MDQQSFKDALKRAGFEEITTKVTPNEKCLAPEAVPVGELESGRLGQPVG